MIELNSLTSLQIVYYTKHLIVAILNIINKTLLVKEILYEFGRFIIFKQELTVFPLLSLDHFWHHDI